MKPVRLSCYGVSEKTGFHKKNTLLIKEQFANIEKQEQAFPE